MKRECDNTATNCCMPSDILEIGKFTDSEISRRKKIHHWRHCAHPKAWRDRFSLFNAIRLIFQGENENSTRRWITIVSRFRHSKNIFADKRWSSNRKYCSLSLCYHCRHRLARSMRISENSPKWYKLWTNRPINWDICRYRPDLRNMMILSLTRNL